MAEDHIVTQHFDDPIGSVIKVDGKCYVKLTSKADIIDTYIPDGDTKQYYSTCEDCATNTDGIMLCLPPDGDPLYVVGEVVGHVETTTGMVQTFPTDMTYSKKPVNIGSCIGRVVIITPVKLPTAEDYSTKWPETGDPDEDWDDEGGDLQREKVVNIATIGSVTGRISMKLENLNPFDSN